MTKIKPSKIEVIRVFHKKPETRIFDILINIPLEEAIQNNEFLREADRMIVETRKETITINDKPNCKEYFDNGILKVEYLDSNPNDDELMKITPRDVAEAEGNEEMMNFYDSINEADC